MFIITLKFSSPKNKDESRENYNIPAKYPLKEKEKVLATKIDK